MILKIEHIQHYPMGENGVKAIWKDHNADKRTKEGQGILCDIVGVTLTENFGYQIVTKDKGGIGYANFNEIQLCLNPLFYLIKPIIVPGYNNGEEFVPVDELFMIFGGGFKSRGRFNQHFIDNILYSAPNSLEYGLIKLLYSWHFAIDIPDDCWIDLNTI